MNPSSDRQRQNRQTTTEHTPTGLRMHVRTPSEGELVEVSPAFRLLQKNQVQPPSPAQWREFSRTMKERLDREADRKSGFRSIQVLRDKFTATDSLALRAIGYVLLATMLGLIALAVWAAVTATSAVPTSSAHATLLHAPSQGVAVSAASHQQLTAEFHTRDYA